MFGYVKPRHSDLLVREHEFYKAAYCGVCRAIRKKTGFLSSLSLSYDMVFLAFCRMTVTDHHVVSRRRKCAAHPFKKRPCLEENEALDFSAAVSAILSLEKLEDDKKDASLKKRWRARLALPVFRRAAKRAALPHLLAVTREQLARLSELEQARTASVDLPAHEFGVLLGAVFTEGLDETQAETFYAVGYHLGKFIYAADAVDDLWEDEKSGDYNPYLLLYGKEAFANGIPGEIKVALRLELSALAEAVEKLPFDGCDAVEGIIKNTVYLGLTDRVDTLGQPNKNKKGTDGYDRSL